MRSTATKAPVGLWLARGSQRPGMSTVVAVSCNPYEESKEHGRPQAAKKSPVGSFLVFGSHPVGMSTVVAAAKTRTGIEQGGGAQHRNQSPSGALVSPRVPTARNVYRGCCFMQPVRGIEGTRPPAGGKKEPSGLFFSVSGCGSQHPRVPWAALASCWPLPQQLLLASATGRSRRCCRFHPVGTSTVVSAAKTRTGILAI